MSQLGSIPRIGSPKSPLSSAQSGIWFAQQRDIGSAFNVPLVIELESPANVAAVRHALSAVVNEHEILRCVFRLVNGIPSQIIQEPRKLVHLEIHERKEEDALGTIDWLNAQFSSQTSLLFDLEIEPPMRAHLYVSSESRSATLLLVFHHIAVDGVSCAIIERDFNSAYFRSLSQGFDFEDGPTPPARASLQYSDYALWEASQLATASVADRLQRRGEQLMGAVGEFAIGPRVTNESLEVRETYEISRELKDASAYRLFAQKMRVTTHIFSMAIFAETLRRWVQKEEFVIGTGVLSRPTQETRELVGCFVQVVPILFSAAARATTAAVCEDIRAQVRECSKFPVLPLGPLLRAAGDDSARGLTALCVVDEIAAGYTSYRGLARGGVTVQAASKSDLMLMVTDSGTGSIAWNFYFDVKSVSRENATLFVDAFLRLTQASLNESNTQPMAYLGMTSVQPDISLGRTLAGPRWSEVGHSNFAISEAKRMAVNTKREDAKR